MARPLPANLQDPTFLAAALEGLELQKQRIEQQMEQIQALLGKRKRGRPRSAAVEAGEAGTEPKQGARKKRRQMSAAARKRIAAAQKRRWAEYHKQKGEGE